MRAAARQRTDPNTDGPRGEPDLSSFRFCAEVLGGRFGRPFRSTRYDPGGRGTARPPDPVSVTAVLFDVDDHVVAQRWYTHRRQLGEHPARFGAPGQVPKPVSTRSRSTRPDAITAGIAELKTGCAAPFEVGDRPPYTLSGIMIRSLRTLASPYSGCYNKSTPSRGDIGGSGAHVKWKDLGGGS